ncbi:MULTISPECIES: hypothetical protein [Acinetobacter]|jgi:hypothetical protein|uniref:hypothetical protein n=1 Tax=Acinetobacter TaxID=469 RepID=UPI0015D3EE5C|nr:MULTISPECIES: hypothetical protein [unclassified Acinetobacter]UUS62596.1 hypothetical protein MST17_17075 [Acinetobacter sp. YH16056_T]
MKSTLEDLEWFEMMFIANHRGIKTLTSQLKEVRKEIKEKQVLDPDDESISNLKLIYNHLVESRKLLQEYEKKFDHMLGMQRMFSVDLELLKDF